MLINSWEIVNGKKVNYIYLYSNELVVGETYGSGHTDTAGACSLEKFLEGQYHSIIIEKFGKEVLDEVVLFVRNSIKK